MNLVRILVVLLLATPAALADWPQWLGPNRDGTSKEKITPWKDKLETVWKKKVGPGHSSPIVAGGKVFLHTHVEGSDDEELTAYDAKSGDKLWNTPYPRGKFKSLFGTGPQATPAFKDGKVFSFGPTGVLACFDADKGALVWRVDAEKDFNAPRLMFGCACSPLLEGDNVIVNVGGKDGSVVAFAQKDGKMAWKAMAERASYSSGVAVGNGESRELLFLTQQGLRGLSPKDGAVRWRYKFIDGLNESSMTPIVLGDLRLISSIKNGMVALKVEKSQGEPTVTEVWKKSELTVYFSTPVLVDKKHAFVVTGRIFIPSSTLHCVDLETGKIAWSKTQIGKYHAALLKASDGRVLLLNDFGDLMMLEPNVEKYREICRTKVSPAEGGLWAHPALVNGLLYIRDEKEMMCLRLP